MLKYTWEDFYPTLASLSFSGVERGQKQDRSCQPRIPQGEVSNSPGVGIVNSYLRRGLNKWSMLGSWEALPECTVLLQSPTDDCPTDIFQNSPQTALNYIKARNGIERDLVLGRCNQLLCALLGVLGNLFLSDPDSMDVLSLASMGVGVGPKSSITNILNDKKIVLNIQHKTKINSFSVVLFPS